MKQARSVLKLIGFLASLTLHAIPLWIRAALGPIDWQHHQAVRQKFAKSAMRILGIEVTVVGAPYKKGPCVYVSNHRSWLDPFVDLAVVWAFPVAKAEVGALPFVAQGAKATGILFVDRSSRESRTTVLSQMVETIQNGHSILIYPEGTTSTEVATRTFKNGAFKVAQKAKCPAVPMAITYSHPKYYWGEGESLWKNFVQIAGEKRTPVKLFIGEAVMVDDPQAALKDFKATIDGFILGEKEASLQSPLA